MNNPVIILGAKKQGEVALDIFSSNHVITYCFLDEDEKMHGTEIDEISVLGDVFDDGYLKLIGKKCNAFVAVEDLSLRKSITENLIERRKVMPVNAVHDKAVVSEKAKIGHGNMIEQGASIGTKVDMANNVMVGANAVIGSHSKIADFVQIGAGSTIGAGVEIGLDAFIGSGVTIVAGVTIGEKARVGAGSVVISDVKEGETVFGNPAKTVS